METQEDEAKFKDFVDDGANAAAPTVVASTLPPEAAVPAPPPPAAEAFQPLLNLPQSRRPGFRRSSSQAGGRGQGGGPGPHLGWLCDGWHTTSLLYQELLTLLMLTPPP